MPKLKWKKEREHLSWAALFDVDGVPYRAYISATWPPPRLFLYSAYLGARTEEFKLTATEPKVLLEEAEERLRAFAAAKCGHYTQFLEVLA